MYIQILLLLLVNILFGIAPLFVDQLAGISPFGIAFFRFFGAALIELVIIFIMLGKFSHQLHSHGIQKEFRLIVKEIFQNYYFTKNMMFFKGRKQITYLAFLGFLLANLSVPFYFLSFRLAGLVISTIFVNSFTLLLIAINNWVKREEEMDFLKVLDLILLIAGIFTIAYSNTQSNVNALNFENIGIIFIVIIAYTAFLIWIARDQSAKLQLFKEINFLQMECGEDLESTALIIRTILKLFGIHILGSLLLLPFAVLVYGLSPDAITGQLSLQFLTEDLNHFFSIMLSPSIIALIILCTALPYFLLIWSQTTWPKYALKHDMWSSVFALVDPLIGLFIGYFLWHESIRGDYILFTTLFLFAGIFIRYFHSGTNLKQVLFVIKVKHNQDEPFREYLGRIREIDQINYLIGTFDFTLHLTVRTVDRLSQIANLINYFPGLEWAYYSVEEPMLKMRSKKTNKIQKWFKDI